jgi:lysozyme family protein
LNGDPLTARTIQFPTGRPIEGNPPFKWEESVADTIRERGYDQWNDWSTAGMLVQWERFSGMQYRNLDHFSPYVWACTDLYVRGKAAPGVDPYAQARNWCGAVAILKGLVATGAIPPPK